MATINKQHRGFKIKSIRYGEWYVLTREWKVTEGVTVPMEGPFPTLEAAKARIDTHWARR